MGQGHLRAYAVLVCAPRGDAPAKSGHLLAHRQVAALATGRVALPTARRAPLLDGRQGPAHHAVPHPHQAPAPHGLDDLGLEELGPGHPPGRRRGAFCLAAWGLAPLAVMGPQRGGLRLAALGAAPGQAAWRHDLDDLLDPSVRPRPGAVADVERQPPRGDGGHCPPEPMRGA
jgi:hypothetical protein